MGCCNYAHYLSLLVMIIIDNLFYINSQKFRNELKKNREKVLGSSEGSSKTKRKEVHARMCLDVFQAVLWLTQSVISVLKYCHCYLYVAFFYGQQILLLWNSLDKKNVQIQAARVIILRIYFLAEKEVK